MILAEKNTNSFTTSKAFETNNFGIKSENLKHLIDLISTDIYSNKPLAVIRETSCNAMDSHIASNKSTVPIKITLPSRFSQDFVVRDFGKGLTHNEMLEIYTSYGASTKRDSNTQVGSFGLGSKVAFCLCDSFNVNSYQNGVKTAYTCVKDASNVGKLILIGTVNTAELDGLEVIVSIGSTDVESFGKEAKKFFKHWSVMPEIEGFTKVEYDEMIGTDKVFVEGTGWKLMDQNTVNSNGSYRSYGSNRNSIALMGNIAYPIVWSNVKGFNEMLMKRRGGGNNSNMEYFITENSIIFNFDIGDVKMAPSREALQYTELTNNSLLKRVGVMLDEVAVNAQLKLNSAANLWDAKIMYNSLFEMGQGLHRLKGSIALKFAGKEITDNNISGFEPVKYPDMFKTYNRRNGNSSFYGYDAKTHGWNSIDCAKGKMILEIDQEDKVYIQKAAQYLADAHKVSTIFTLKFKDAAQRKEVFDETGLDDSFITKYSIISDAVKDTIVRNVGGKVTSVKKDTTIRSLRVMKSDNLSTRNSYYYYGMRDLALEDVDMVVGGIYIEADKNLLKSSYSFGDISILIANIEKLRGSPVTVHFIGQNLMNGKLMQQGKWVKFEDFVTEQATKVMQKDASLGVMLAYDSIKVGNSFYEYDDTLMALLKKNNIHADLTMVADLVLDKKAGEKAIVKKHLIATDADIKTVKDLFARVVKQFPLLRVFNNAYYHTHSDTNEKLIIEYLKEKAV
jgi:hypothetical protein